MTEEEAKTKWCPFVRHANGSNGVGVNRVNWDKTYEYANCIASDCMAWRRIYSLEETVRLVIHPDGDITADGTEKPKRDGFCGLAGKL